MKRDFCFKYQSVCRQVSTQSFIMAPKAASFVAPLVALPHVIRRNDSFEFPELF